MKIFELSGKLRPDTGKKATHKLRKDGMVPCVIYGGEKNISFYAETPAFRHLVYSPNVYNVRIDIEGTLYIGILQDLQFHPVSDALLHIDFLQIFEDKKFIIHIPLHLNGLSVGVREGGSMHQPLRSLKVKGFIKDIPDTFNVDVSELGIGQSIKVGDLSYENLELLDSKNAVVAAVKVTRASKELAEGEATAGAAAAPAAAATAAKPAAAAPAAKKDAPKK